MKKIVFFCFIAVAVVACKNQSKKEAMPQAPTSSANVQDIQANKALITEDLTESPQFLPPNEKAKSPKSSIISKETNTIISDKAPERKIIRTAEMRFKVAKTENASYKIEQIVKHFGGFVTQTRMNSQVIEQKEVPISADSVLQITQYELQNNMIVRIPNAQLDTVLLEISRIYLFLDYRRLSADDVTLAYLSDQLKAKIRERAAQHIQNATDSKGNRLSDITNAETNSAQLQADAVDNTIHTLQKDYDVQYSTLTLDIYQDRDIATITKATPSVYAYGPSFFTRLKEAISTGWAGLLDMFLGLVSIWYLFVLGGFAWFLYKKYGVGFKFQRKIAKI